MISSGEAFLLLKKWKTEKSLTRLLFALESSGGSLFGIITDVEGSNVRVAGVDSRSEFLLDLSEASFGYSDPREAPDELRDKSSAMYLGCLTAILPSGNRFCFFELDTEER